MNLNKMCLSLVFLEFVFLGFLFLNPMISLVSAILDSMLENLMANSLDDQLNFRCSSVSTLIEFINHALHDILYNMMVIDEPPDDEKISLHTYMKEYGLSFFFILGFLLFFILIVWDRRHVREIERIERRRNVSITEARFRVTEAILWVKMLPKGIPAA